MIEIGESLVSAYLRLIEFCDIIEYNFVLPKQIVTQGEIDVVGLNFEDKKLFLCEVTTHLQTMNYGSREETTNKIRQKLERNHKFADMKFSDWEVFHMVWSPTVGKSMTDDLNAMINKLNGIKVTLIFNEEYATRVMRLIEKASNDIKDYNEPFFRSLQILAHLRMPNQNKLFNSLVFNDRPQDVYLKKHSLVTEQNPRYHYEAAMILLKDIGKPTHIEKLTQMLKEVYPNLFNEEYNSHRLQATVTSYLNIFKRYGKGIIGLKEWD
ncbi:MAG: hypothetical protein ACOX42_09740 [Clostridia bacterium]